MSEDPTALSDLFARDPFTLSDLDLDKMIESYREARKHFATGGAKAAKVAPNASLADLGLA